MPKMNKFESIAVDFMRFFNLEPSRFTENEGLGHKQTPDFLVSHPNGFAFYCEDKSINFDEFLKNAAIGYVFKLMVAVALIPVIYFLHRVIHKYIHTAEEDGIKN